ncbi:MAG: phosphoenolpyruvate carboxykinase (ATP) [Deltaproteobacteria bacterium CG07_land_8_20_14_0_80_38_7]|nr:MAG: phosphoenolpyruvate carboxykinase (ATP) [Deltaproteobacteria bacterium CG07_land_8_20_14_0_80_38_7]
MEIGTNKNVYHNLSVPRLIEMSILRSEGTLADNGALVINGLRRKGRSPLDRFIVDRPEIHDEIWWGEINIPVSVDLFEKILSKTKDYLSTKDLFVFDGFAGADPTYRLPVRVIAEKAWHGLFSQTLFIRPTDEELKTIKPEFTVINACDLVLDPKTDGTKSEVFIGVDLVKKVVLITGTYYGGEIKKSIFSVMNYLLPMKDIFSMHCSANIGKSGDTALFFGLSGTGKTTLSADPDRRLIGDDEHGWSDKGIFNFEGGCYAKVIKLSKEKEPQIWKAIRFGSILENVVVDPVTGSIDYNDGSITENTRATYPVDYIPNCIIPSLGDHPKNIVFLTCDAFGVLPPIAELTKEMAMFHFISGYTSKVAGTEAGIVEPVTTFSSCFGAPFLPLHPTRYAELLGECLKKHDAKCWLVNTGWSGGGYGVGNRMDIALTRQLLTSAITGKLDKVRKNPDPIFKVLVPEECAGVPKEMLVAKNTWKDKTAYDNAAKQLALGFMKNFEQFAEKAGKEVIEAGPVGYSSRKTK